MCCQPHSIAIRAGPYDQLSSSHTSNPLQTIKLKIFDSKRTLASLRPRLGNTIVSHFSLTTGTLLRKKRRHKKYTSEPSRPSPFSTDAIRGQEPLLISNHNVASAPKFIFAHHHFTKGSERFQMKLFEKRRQRDVNGEYVSDTRRRR